MQLGLAVCLKEDSEMTESQHRRWLVRLAVGGGLALALWIVAAVLDQPVYAGNCSWTGYVSSEWTVPGNWGSGCTGVDGIPGAADTVDIPGSGVVNEPSLGGSIILQELRIQWPRVLSLSANATLNTSLTNLGTLALGARTLTLTGSTFFNFGTLALGTGTLTFTDSAFANQGLMSGTGAVRTQGTVIIELGPYSTFNPPLEVVSGTATAWGGGVFNGLITIVSGATLQVSAGGALYAYDDVIVNGTLGGGDSASYLSFLGATLTNNGVISLPSVYFWGTGPQSIAGTGSWTGNGWFSTVADVALANDMSMAFSIFTIQSETFSLSNHALTFTSPTSLSIVVYSTFDIGNQPLTIMAPEGSIIEIDGTVSGTGMVKTQGPVLIGQQGVFNPPLTAVSGTMTAYGSFNGAITVASEATFQVSVGTVVYAYDDVIVNGTLSGGDSASYIVFYGSTLTNNGVVSVPSIYFYGVHTVTGTGSFIDNTATIQSGSTVTLGSNHRMSNVIVNGSLTTPGVLLDLSGDFTNNGTYTHANGALRFDGGAVQNLVLNVLTTFYNLDVASGTTLVETVAADNASVAGTLTNNGVIRKTRSVGGPGALSFGLTGVSMDVTTAGSLSQVQVGRIDRDHPNANALTTTGRYWTITPTGAGYTVNLTLPRPASVPANALVCRNATGGWDCATSASTATTVTRSGISELSDWAVGVGADVTTVQEVAGRWGTAAGGPGFDPLFDMDRNGVIDIRDVMLVASLWNAGG